MAANESATMDSNERDLSAVSKWLNETLRIGGLRNADKLHDLARYTSCEVNSSRLGHTIPPRSLHTAEHEDIL
jgi:hypothetical protein